MRILSTRVNHIFYGHFTTLSPGYITVCKCPAGMVWEVHNLTLSKLAGGASTFTHIFIIRNGVTHNLNSYKAVDIAASACHPFHKIIYMKPGDVLKLQVNAWVNYLTFQIAYGIVEHRDH